jgi:hypothetical protein
MRGLAGMRRVIRFVGPAETELRSGVTKELGRAKGTPPRVRRSGALALALVVHDHDRGRSAAAA